MINFENGILEEDAYVIINGTKYPVVMPQISGNTPISAENLNKLQLELESNIKNVPELIATGSLTSSTNVTIDVDFTKYKRIIFEIISSSNSIIEGSSNILEISNSGELINRVVNFYNQANATFLCYGFLYQNGNSLKLVVKKLEGWSSRNYRLIGILNDGGY